MNKPKQPDFFETPDHEEYVPLCEMENRIHQLLTEGYYLVVVQWNANGMHWIKARRVQEAKRP